MTRVARFAARRLAWAALSAWLASVVAFAVFWAVPNVDPEFNLGGGVRGTDESRERARVEYGLDQPLPTQYVRLMGGIFGGDLECYSSCGNLRDDLVARLPVTLWLVAGAMAFALALGTALALVCVRHHGGRVDRLVLGAAAVLQSVPSLVLSAVLWAYLCRRTEVFPYSGYTGVTEHPLRWAWHLALPWLAAGLPFAGVYAQVIRASLLETRTEEWVRVARAKGLPERTVLRRHVLRNALLPPLSVVGLDASHAIGGFVLYVEVVFGLPGVGQLTEAALVGLDLPAVVALAVWLALVVVVVSAVADVVAAALDPRVARP